MDKSSLRNKIKLRRIQMSKSSELIEISNKIVSKILRSDDFKKSKNIALYYPLAGEINLLDLLNYKDKIYFFPKCNKSDLQFAKYEGRFIKGAYSIPEPDTLPVEPSILDIIYIPCLCCNSDCYRLGYGKGYYDRFFTNNKVDAKKIIVTSECFITNEFCEDKHDFQADYILCEN